VGIICMELLKFQLIFFFHLYDLVNMDERRHKVLVAFVSHTLIRLNRARAQL
jgi:hypothetical protein